MVHTRWFPVAVIAVIICLVLAVFTGAAKKDSIISRTLGGVLLPAERGICLLYTSPSPRDMPVSRMPSSA